MNGAECEECGLIPCKCKEIKIRKKREQFNIDILEQFYQILTKPKRIRLKILKWLYPEIIHIADELKIIIEEVSKFK